MLIAPEKLAEPVPAPAKDGEIVMTCVQPPLSCTGSKTLPVTNDGRTPITPDCGGVANCAMGAGLPGVVMLAVPVTPEPDVVSVAV